MSGWNGFVEMISEKGRETAEAAKKMADITKLKGKISGIETEIKKNCCKMGEAYYEAYKDDEIIFEFEEYMEKIREAKKEIEKLKQKINEIKGEAVCKSCGSIMKTGAAFCSGCGSKMEEDFSHTESEEMEKEVVKVDFSKPLFSEEEIKMCVHFEEPEEDGITEDVEFEELEEELLFDEETEEDEITEDVEFEELEEELLFDEEDILEIEFDEE